MSAMTFATMLAKYPGARKKIWALRALQSRNRKSIFEKAVGNEESQKSIIRKNDLKKSKGDKITMTVTAPLGGKARRGSQSLRGHEENLKINTYDMQIDFIRHAVAVDEKHKKLAAVDFDYIITGRVGEHCALTMDDDLAMMYRLKAISANHIYGGGKANEDALVSADVLTGSLIETAGEVCRGRGAEPTKVIRGTEGGELDRYLCFIPHTLLANLRRTDEWRTGIQNAGPQSKDNALFTGEYWDWNGHLIVPHQVVDTDANGPSGSAWLPKAYLGEAITAGSTVVIVKGGANANGAALTDPEYFGFFSNYDWKWTEDQASADFTGIEKFFAIYNVTGNDANKYCIYAYTVGNNGNTITITKRLGASTISAGGGVTFVTLAGITYNASLHTFDHPVGSVIVQVNAKCVPIGHWCMSGAESAYRGDGMDTIKEIRDDDDYEWVKGVGYCACYGQTVSLDTNNEPRGYVFVTCAVNHPALPMLPNVT